MVETPGTDSLKQQNFSVGYIYVVALKLLYFLEGLIKRFLQLARGLAQFILIYIPQLVLDRHYVRIPFLLKRSLTLPRVHFH